MKNVKYETSRIRVLLSNRIGMCAHVEYRIGKTIMHRSFVDQMVYKIDEVISKDYENKR